MAAYMSRFGSRTAIRAVLLGTKIFRTFRSRARTSALYGRTWSRSLKETSLEFVQGSHRGPLFNPSAFNPEDVSRRLVRQRCPATLAGYRGNPRSMAYRLVGDEAW